MKTQYGGETMRTAMRIAAAALMLGIGLAAWAPRGLGQVGTGATQEFFQAYQAANQARMAGDFEKAADLFKKCLDPKFASDPTVGSFQPMVHQALAFLYANYLNLPDEARMHAEKYVAFAETQIQTGTQGMEMMNASYEMQISEAYRMIGEYDKVIEHALKSIEYYEAARAAATMPEADALKFEAGAYYSVARGYKLAGDAEKSKENFEKAAEKYKELTSSDSDPGNALQLAYIDRELGDNVGCVSSFEKFAAESEKAGDAQGRIMVGTNRRVAADCLYRAGKWDEAAGELEMAIKTLEGAAWVSEVWQSYDLQGRAYEKAGKQDAALAAYKKAVESIESQRSGLSGGDDRAAFMDMRIGVYRDIIHLLIEMGQPDGALEYLERSKARSFLDILGGAKIALASKEETKLLDSQVDMERQINNLEQSLMTRSQGQQQTVSPEEKQRQMEEVRRQYGELMLEIKKMRPEFTSMATVTPPELDEIMGLLDDETAILEFYPMEDSLNVWVIRKDGIALKTTDTAYKALESQIGMLRAKVTRGTPNDAYVRTAQTLYDMLIGPAEEGLKGIKNLVIVPHAALHYLPFNALMKGDKFLIEAYEITIVPSSSAMKYFAEKENPDGRKLLALGDPQTNLPDLPGAKAEVEQIKSDFSGAKVYFGKDAVESLLFGPDAQAADEIHIASHGIFYADRPMLSSLVLSPDPKHGKDGYLRVHEIFGLNLKAANLVVLSACQTGLSQVGAGDDLVGLSRAFIYAGSPRVVVSLWSVNDAATGQLMKAFYEGMKNKSAPTALRDAQMQLMQNPEFRHPFFWAPFQLTGDWR